MGVEREREGELMISGVRADERVVEDNGLSGSGFAEEGAGGEEVVVSGVGVD